MRLIMANEVLHSLLKEYEQKKLRAELDLEKRKEELYEELPRLRDLESDLNHFAILTSKNILLHNTDCLEDLNKKIKNLKAEKVNILKEANLPARFFNASL